MRTWDKIIAKKVEVYYWRCSHCNREICNFQSPEFVEAKAAEHLDRVHPDVTAIHDGIISTQDRSMGLNSDLAAIYVQVEYGNMTIKDANLAWLNSVKYWGTDVVESLVADPEANRRLRELTSLAKGT